MGVLYRGPCDCDSVHGASTASELKTRHFKGTYCSAPESGSPMPNCCFR